MIESWENEIVRKKDLIDWIDRVVTAYEDLQELYRGSKDCTEVIATLSAVADHVHWMKPYDSNDISYRGTRMYEERLGESERK